MADRRRHRGRASRRTPAADSAVTLLESPDVGPIGVGEGTWPTMRDTLRKIGVTRDRLHPRVRRLVQAGLEVRALGHGREDDYYFHPFVLPQGYTETNLVAGWLQRHADVPFADLVSFQPHLCAHGKAPKQVADAGVRGGRELRVSPRRRQVRRVPAQALRREARRAARARSHGRHQLARQRRHRRHCRRKTNGALAGDLFVDCTGMQSLLLGEHYGVPFVSQKHVLFNDTALALQVPYADERQPDRLADDLHRAEQRLDLGHRAAHAARRRPRLFERAHLGRCSRARAARTTSSAPAGRRTAAAPRKLVVQSRLSRASSGIATALPSGSPPASSSRWRPRRSRWSSCRRRC